VLIAKSSNRLGRRIITPGTKIKVGWNINELLLVESDAA
jgi:hypothetical protein